jgi:hypothetical protein
MQTQTRQEAHEALQQHVSEYIERVNQPIQLCTEQKLVRPAAFINTKPCGRTTQIIFLGNSHDYIATLHNSEVSIESRTVNIWDLKDSRRVRSILCVNCSKIASLGDSLLVIASNADDLQVYNWRTGQKKNTIKTELVSTDNNIYSFGDRYILKKGQTQLYVVDVLSGDVVLQSTYTSTTCGRIIPYVNGQVVLTPKHSYNHTFCVTNNMMNGSHNIKIKQLKEFFLVNGNTMVAHLHRSLARFDISSPLNPVKLNEMFLDDYPLLQVEAHLGQALLLCSMYYADFGPKMLYVWDGDRNTFVHEYQLPSNYLGRDVVFSSVSGYLICKERGKSFDEIDTGDLYIHKLIEIGQNLWRRLHSCDKFYDVIIKA